MSLSPQQVIDTADGLMGLAAILKDPDTYQAKLDELKAHAKEGNEAFDKANLQKQIADQESVEKTDNA